MTKEIDELPNDKQFDHYLKRVHELRGSGKDWAYASGLAGLEHRINAWPSAWGDDLWILIYGDFEPPSVDLHFPSLGITVHHEKLENTVVQSARCVLRATVTSEH